MILRKILMAGLLFMMMSAAATAETLVLVQGYLGSAMSWRAKSITAILHNAGWADAGHMTMSPAGPLVRASNIRAPNRFYTIDLPTEAPLMVQSRVLAGYISLIHNRHGSEPIILAGHSAGGVVARLFMVNNPRANVRALVTIASPHLGTEAAELGRLVGSTPLSWFAPMIGANTLNRSQGLYHDLMRERPNNLLGWLNRRAHPRASYISVVRRNGGRSIVPDWSQDMNRVPALAGKARTIVTRSGHGLRPADAVILIGILNALSERA